MGAGIAPWGPSSCWRSSAAASSGAGERRPPRQRGGGEAAALQSTDEGYDPKTREALLQRQKDTQTVVERGMTVTSALLGAASGLPLVGPLCQVVQNILGDVEEFSEK